MGVNVKPSLEWIVSGGLGFLVGVCTHVSPESKVYVHDDNLKSLLIPGVFGCFLSTCCYSSKFSLMKFARNASACTAGYMAGAVATTSIVNLLRY